MGSALTIDLDRILAPIPGDNPAGGNVRLTRYDIIREARREDEALPQGEWKPKGPPKIADWTKVVEVSSTVLATESKDLQVAAWLLEGLVKLHGYAGLRDGLHVIKELHARYWDTVFPEIDDEDLESRAAPIEWLNERHKAPFFPFAVKSIPVFHSGDGVAYSFHHWEEAREVENLALRDKKAHKEAVDEGKIDKKQLDKAITGTPLTHCLSLQEDVNACVKEVAALDAVVTEKYGDAVNDRPSLQHLKEVIETCQGYLEETLQMKGGVSMGVTDAVASPPEATQTGTDGVRVSVSPQATTGIDPVDRLDALRRLAAVAEFFRRTEPHSPVAYLVQRATRWGEMPLEDWLHEVIKSKDVLGSVRETLGLNEESAK